MGKIRLFQNGCSQSSRFPTCRWSRGTKTQTTRLTLKVKDIQCRSSQVLVTWFSVLGVVVAAAVVIFVCLFALTI